MLPKTAKKTTKGSVRIVKQHKCKSTHKRRDTEHKEQVKIATFIDKNYPDCDWTSMMQGVHIGAKYGAYMKAKGVKTDWPDIVVDDAHGGYFGLRIELKKLGEKPRPGQMEKIKRKMKEGYCSVWSDDTTQVLDIIKWYKALPKTKIPRGRPVYNPFARLKKDKKNREEVELQIHNLDAYTRNDDGDDEDVIDLDE
jgi:hypothetical protein